MRGDRYLEEQIEELAYPATLKAPVKRMLTVTLHEIGQRFMNEQTRLQRTDRAYRDIPLAELASAELALVQDYEEAKKRMKEAEEDFVTYFGAGAHCDQFRVWKRLTERELEARRKQHDNAMKELTQGRDADLAKLKALVREIADLEIAKLRAKIPADLQRRLEQLTTAPPAQIAEVIDAEPTDPREQAVMS